MTVGFAKKIGMTRIFIDQKAVPVTALEFGETVVVQTKTKEKDGYEAVQLGAFPRKSKKTPKSITGHIKKHSDVENNGFYCLKEFGSDLVGDKTKITIEDFEVGSHFDVCGTTKGHGFTGVVKRHGFAGQPASHGHDHERAPGSIGSRWPQMTVKGKKMAGHDGNTKNTVKNLKVVAVDKEQGLIFVAGSVPGPNSGYLSIAKAKNN